MSAAGPLPGATTKLRRGLTTAHSACHGVGNSAMRHMEDGS